MIAIKKLRSICQQMTEYDRRHEPTPRARDFCDIHAIVTEGGVRLDAAENIEVLHAVFAAKSVPRHLLARVADYRDLHEENWHAVGATIPPDRDRRFETYFDFVLRQIRRLESLGVVDAP